MFQSFTIIISLAALFSYINHRFLKLPSTIGLMLLALLTSIVSIGIKFIDEPTFMEVCRVVTDIDFRELLMDMMLSFLLFAGAFHVNLKDLSKEKVPVIVFSTVGVLLSTFIVGGLTYLILNGLGFNVPFLHTLLFGALISPTDPVAVLAIIKQFNVSKDLELKISGESLFNDGVGVVIFVSILMLVQGGAEDFGVGEIAKLFLEEAVGGVVYGAILGFLGLKLLQSIDDTPKIAVLLTVAIATGGYSLASIIHVSGPLAMVVAGLIIGNKIDMKHEKSEQTLDMFWDMLDDTLNAVLFVLIGLEIHTLTYDHSYLLAGLLVYVAVLVARSVSVGIPFSLLRHKKHSPKATIAILTWGGLRGGISVALALSLTSQVNQELFVFITYTVVLISILLQGLTIGKLVKKLNLPSN